MSAVAQYIQDKFCVLPPLFASSEADSIKLEIKPYLKKFEQDLAIRELNALLGQDEIVSEQGDYWTITSKRDEIFFREQLTYWQRVGREVLYPTVQNALELTQNGLSNLENNVGNLHRSRRLRYGPHDIHEYRGKFFPQLVRSLITISQIPKSGFVLDPMCGSGTTCCESIAFGYSAIAADLNPLSLLISKVKASIPREKSGEFLSKVSDYMNSFSYGNTDLEMLWSSDDISYLQKWFADDALLDLAKISAEIKRLPAGLEAEFLSVCFSNIIRSSSWQKATDLRVRKEIQPYITGTAIKSFEDGVTEQLKKIDAYLSVLPAVPLNLVVDIREGNAVKIADLFEQYVGTVDALITSPPYATALPYLDTDRLSLIVLNLLPRKAHRDREIDMIGTREVSERQRKDEWENFQKRKRELPQNIINLIDSLAINYHSEAVGFRRKNLPALLSKYFLNMLDAMKSARILMRQNAPAYYVVGNNSTEVNGERVEIPTDEFLFEIGAVAGWQQEETINMDLLPSRDIFKANRGSKESILVFRA